MQSAAERTCSKRTQLLKEDGVPIVRDYADLGLLISGPYGLLHAHALHPIRFKCAFTLRLNDSAFAERFGSGMA
jgi:hypothetical protein